jgi:hypothetical protein
VNARTPQEDVKITVGYKALPGQKDDRLEQRTVQPAAGDAPPWDATTQFALVGTDVDRVDGLAKASGRAKYSYDVTFPGMLQAMILRSPVARGKLTVLELDEAARMPGIQAVVALRWPASTCTSCATPSSGSAPSTSARSTTSTTSSPTTPRWSTTRASSPRTGRPTKA